MRVAGNPSMLTSNPTGNSKNFSVVDDSNPGNERLTNVPVEL